MVDEAIREVRRVSSNRERLKFVEDRELAVRVLETPRMKRF
jgi:hypothetical protein